jgi:hypothetical protein
VLQGINRLGKGAAKPGTLRPADPNRFKTEDFFSVEAEDDPEYLRRIVEVWICIKLAALIQKLFNIESMASNP